MANYNLIDPALLQMAQPDMPQLEQAAQLPAAPAPNPLLQQIANPQEGPSFGHQLVSLALNEFGPVGELINQERNKDFQQQRLEALAQSVAQQPPEVQQFLGGLVQQGRIPEAFKAYEQFGLKQIENAPTRAIREREADLREQALKNQQAGIALQQRGLALRNIELANRIEDKAERKQAIADATAILQPAGDLLSGQDKLRFNAALKEGNLAAARNVLVPKTPKPGSFQHLLQEHQAGRIDLTNMDQVRSYFNSNLAKGRGEAAAKLFEERMLTNRSWASFLPFVSDQRQLSDAGAQAVQQGQLPPKTITLKAPSGATKVVADTPENRKLAAEKKFEIIQ